MTFFTKCSLKTVRLVCLYLKLRSVVLKKTKNKKLMKWNSWVQICKSKMNLIIIPRFFPLPLWRLFFPFLPILNSAPEEKRSLNPGDVYQKDSLGSTNMRFFLLFSMPTEFMICVWECSYSEQKLLSLASFAPKCKNICNLPLKNLWAGIGSGNTLGGRMFVSNTQSHGFNSHHCQKERRGCVSIWISFSTMLFLKYISFIQYIYWNLYTYIQWNNDLSHSSFLLLQLPLDPHHAPSQLHALLFCFITNPFSPIAVAHIWMGVWPSMGAWETYQAIPPK